jgi:hypothetical protein
VESVMGVGVIVPVVVVTQAVNLILALLLVVGVEEVK